MAILNGLQPERVLYYFEEICRIPHGSGNTDAISGYCVGVAERLGLFCRRDEWNNVIIRKPASAGYAEHPPVILQGHLDMVCEKEEDCPLDLAVDGLQLDVDGDWLFAHGTTLGGDDGIAVAMVLAILEDTTLSHPPIEAVFTTDEETGMYGAAGLDVADLAGRTLINIDSEEEGVLTVSCAGGARADIRLDLTREALHLPVYQVTVSGLIGGHSGVEIDKGRLNANVVMGRFLQSLPGEYRVVSVAGGQKDNAIPRQTVCVLATHADLQAAAEAFVQANRVDTDPGLTITVEPATADTAFDAASGRTIAGFLSEVPNGVIAMSQNIDGLVETSLNMGVLASDETGLSATFAVRSSVNADKTALLERLKRVAEDFGGTVSAHGHYPAWEYRRESRLRDTMVAVYADLYGRQPVVQAIHAGLECGLFSDKIAGLDAVSFGPNMQDIHTTRERLSISSVERTYRYLLAVLAAL